MKIAEIQRDLKGNVDPKLLYWMSWMIEKIMAQQQEIETLAATQCTIADAMGVLGGVVKKNDDLVESVLVKPGDEETH